MSHKQDELAVKECLVLWKYLAQSGTDNKYNAIQKLYGQGKLSKNYYSADCPLCDQFNCLDCPWRTVPNLLGDYNSCIILGSHYKAWTAVRITMSGSRKERQKVASGVYKFLKQIKMSSKPKIFTPLEIAEYVKTYQISDANDNL